MRKKRMIKKVMITIILCIICGIGSYFGTLFLDNLRKGGNVSMKVTFDDTKSYVIPSVKKMTKDEALKEWPYMMDVHNEGNAKGLYQIIIKEKEKSNIQKDVLSYTLFLDDKEVSEGKVSDIKNNVLYTYEIDGGKKQRYKLYIWVNDDIDDSEEKVYEYELTFNTIKAGGPGF